MQNLQIGRGSYDRLAHGPESIEEVINDAPTRVANFTDPGRRRQATMNKFLNRIDGWLDTVIGTPADPCVSFSAGKSSRAFQKDNEASEKYC
jgi:hypothetical protein